MQLRISVPIIKAIGAVMGATYQQPIQQVLKQRESELEEMHSRSLLGVRHNASVKAKKPILQSIARNYLGLDNWKDVKG